MPENLVAPQDRSAGPTWPGAVGELGRRRQVPRAARAALDAGRRRWFDTARNARRARAGRCREGKTNRRHPSLIPACPGKRRWEHPPESPRAADLGRLAQLGGDAVDAVGCVVGMTGQMHPVGASGLGGDRPQRLTLLRGRTPHDLDIRGWAPPGDQAEGPAALGGGGDRDATGVDDDQANRIGGVGRGLLPAPAPQPLAHAAALVRVDLAAEGDAGESQHAIPGRRRRFAGSLGGKIPSHATAAS